ncbi:MAG: hypothetical protein KAX20_07405, partial [Candidatus Omnitrophica bacterium]|nr:hypothetical protein [Candidatus Omnitrophota bacterium]
ETYRFNWNSPILISPHDPKTVYFGGNKLFKSSNRGEIWEVSIDLTTQQDREKLPIMGILTDENTLSRNDGITFYGDITTISESPLKKGLLYVGIDDGNLQVSRDGGETWKNVINRIPEVPKYTYVSRVIASRFDEGRAYVTFDGHRNDDFKPYVFVTVDYGESWRSIAGNLPEGGTLNVIREHHRNPNLLFVGTERGAYVSINRGRRWVRMKGNLPIVPVDDIAIHPRENDLIFGTHGRSIWILDDITPLECLSNNVLASRSYLFKVRAATLFIPYDHKGTIGHRAFVAPNPPLGAMIHYYLKNGTKESVKIIIKDEEGKKIRELKGPKEAGINRITWNLRYDPPPQTVGGEFGRHFRTRAPKVLPGEYKVTMEVLGQEMTETVKVLGDPRLNISLEDRKAQHDVLFTLYKLYPVLYSTVETLNSIEIQIADIEKALKKVSDVPELVFDEVKAISKKIGDIRLELLGNPKLGWPGVSGSVRGKLVLLGRAIEGYTAPLSKRQVQQIQKNSEKLENLAKRLNKIVKKDIPELNKLMIEKNITFQMPGD